MSTAQLLHSELKKWGYISSVLGVYYTKTIQYKIDITFFLQTARPRSTRSCFLLRVRLEPQSTHPTTLGCKLPLLLFADSFQFRLIDAPRQLFRCLLAPLAATAVSPASFMCPS